MGFNLETQQRDAEGENANEKMDFTQTDILTSKRGLKFHLHTIWLFTCNDFKTIIYTQTAVGTFSALAGPSLTTNESPDLLQIMSRVPLVCLWNWLNLIVFNIANQRLPDSVLEDQINKPWRPMPTGRLSSDEARKLLLYILPFGLIMINFIGAFEEALWMIALTWMYNDLGGADHYAMRNLLQAVAFVCHARGSTIVAAGPYHTLGPGSTFWFSIIGAIVFTSIQTQDLEDMEGDSKRDRKTIPLVFGETIGRLSVALPVSIWSIICPYFWQLEVLGYIPSCLIGFTIAGRVLVWRNVKSDKITWKLWCLWIIAIYLLPLLKDYSVFSR